MGFARPEAASRQIAAGEQAAKRARNDRHRFAMQHPAAGRTSRLADHGIEEIIELKRTRLNRGWLRAMKGHQDG
jgi:hypothetical protein